jgi:hypothetical protein
MKGELFYTKNRNESMYHFFKGKIIVKVVLFCIILLHFLGDNCQSISTFFYDMQKIVCTTRYESLFFSLICLINSRYALVNQTANS